MQSFLNDKNYKLLKFLSNKESSLIALVVNKNGKKFVCRIYDHSVPAYGVLIGFQSHVLPEVTDSYEYEGMFIVEEEYIDGIKLSEILEVYKPDTSQTAAIGEKICCALSEIHEKGIIHRDVKPENIMITSDAGVYLIDLDASSSFNPVKDRDTCLLGTAGYAAPEQFGFGRSDVRTDIFSLGVMLNVMLTGQHPSRELAPGGLRPTIEKCIEVNADKRYSSAKELGNTLSAYTAQSIPCPDCGFLSPGGGCLCCGKTSGYKPKKKKRKWLIPSNSLLIIAALAFFVLARGDFNSQSPDDSTHSPSPSLAAHPLSEETPEISSSPSPEPTTEAAEETAEEQTIRLYGGEFSPVGWLPTETSSLSQTEIEKFYGDVYFDEYDNPFFPSTANDMLDQFRYDLDGDGHDETYFFSVMMNTEEPRHFLPFDSVGRPFNEDDWIKRTAVPVVYKQVAVGEYEPVKELTDMLQDAKVELYYIDLRYGIEGADMPEVYHAPPLDEQWNNAVYIKYKLKSIGHYAVTASAKFNELELSGYCITTLRSDWNGIEIEE